jgi:hypothetical protein
MSASSRSIARSAGDQVRQSRDHRPERLPELGDAFVVRLARPLVHEDLLELERQRASRVGVTLVDPPHQLGSPEADVLPDVQRPSRDALRTHPADEAVHDPVPARTIERPGPYVELRVLGRRCRKSVSPMVVRMDVQYHEGALCREAIQPISQCGVETVVAGERSLHRVGRQRPLPHPEAPRVARCSVDGVAPGAIQVDLEP